MSKYAVVFEKTSTGFSAYIPDLPGCVATGRALDETKRLIHEAMGSAPYSHAARRR